MSQELPPNEKPGMGWSEEPVHGEVVNPPHDYHAASNQPERGSRISYSALFWSAMLIMAGTIFLSDQLNLLPHGLEAGPWEWLLLGAGVLLLFGALLRALIRDFSRPSIFGIVIAFVVLFLGVKEVFSVDLFDSAWFWPAALIAIGLAMLGGAIRR